MANVTIFSNAAGRVLAFPESGLPAVAAVKVDEFEEFTTSRSIITRVGFSRQANASFRHTVGGAVHIYTFGDRIGEAVVSGLCFDNGCDENEFSGLKYIDDYYNKHRVSERADPIKITLGAVLSLNGYLTSVTCDIAETTSRVYQYTFKLVLVPEPQRLAEGDEESGADPGLSESAGNLPMIEISEADLPQAGVTSLDSLPGWPGGTTDIGGAIGQGGAIGLPPANGFVDLGTGPSTVLTNGFN